jgi:DNA-binding MarR family transcriptional regulator
MDLELINWLKDGKYRVKTLELLYKKPLLSSELAKELDINRASMSRILKDLKEQKLVSHISNNTRTVTYILTEKAKKIIKDLEAEK